ncbi:MAG: sugar transferase [Leptolyngbya sp. Prado105]|jgi:exopolysaccharide biosynthesis polyprenyl glycosylphosphotransferase|nr:sugar transferase [Leptolyngbya sp. Prado105]
MSTTASFKPATKAQPVITTRYLAILLLLGDLIGLATCWQIASWLRYERFVPWNDPLTYLFSGLVLAALYLSEAYRPDTQVVGLRAPLRILIGGIGFIGLIASIIYLSGYRGGNLMLNRGVWLVGFSLFTVWAVFLRLVAASWLRSHTEQRNWLILGLDQNALQFVQSAIDKSSLKKFVVLTEQPEAFSKFSQMGLRRVMRSEELPDWGSRLWSGVLLSADLDLTEAQVRQLMQIRLQGIPVLRLPDFYEALWYKLPADLLQDDWFVFSNGFNLLPDGISSRFKRLFDVLVSGLLLIALAPIMLLVAIVIKIDDPGPVFYSQLRTGLNRHPFKVYKFRSMRQDAEKFGAQWASERDPRITRIGYWLRLTRLDELPQFWNVLQGDMSLIGPRPERPEFDAKLEQDIPYYAVRYLVKPGITGWAQVMYPYGASVEDAYEKLSYDLYYIKNYSIWLDIAIVFKTIRVVLLGKGR